MRGSTPWPFKKEQWTLLRQSILDKMLNPQAQRSATYSSAETCMEDVFREDPGFGLCSTDFFFTLTRGLLHVLFRVRIFLPSALTLTDFLVIKMYRL